jgi:hypothetical protein
MLERPGPTREDRLHVRGLLVELFEETGRQEQAAVWRARPQE